MYAYTVNAQMHLFSLFKCTNAFLSLWTAGLVVFSRRKKARSLAGYFLQKKVNGRTCPTRTHGPGC